MGGPGPMGGPMAEFGDGKTVKGAPLSADIVVVRETVLADGNYERAPFLRVVQMLHRHKGVERAMERAQNFTEKARAALGAFPESACHRALFAVTDLVTVRDH